MLLRETLGVVEFVNADAIALGLAAFRPELVALEAGTIMLNRLKELGRLGRSFAFETTLSSRSLAPWLAELIQTNYEFHLVYLWLPNEQFALDAGWRIACEWVAMTFPRTSFEDVNQAGLRNFFSLYRPLATRWRMYNNSDMTSLRLIASGKGNSVEMIENQSLWEQIEKEYAHGG